MFFFFLINGADKTNKAKCGQNKAELFPAFDSLAGKVPIRTRAFLQNPHALLSNNVFEVELAQEIQLFFVAQLFVLFLRFFPGVVSVRQVACFKRKERSCTGLETATLSLHGAAVWRSEKQQDKEILRQELSWQGGE